MIMFNAHVLNVSYLWFLISGLGIRHCIPLVQLGTTQKSQLRNVSWLLGTQIARWSKNGPGLWWACASAMPTKNTGWLSQENSKGHRLSVMSLDNTIFQQHQPNNDNDLRFPRYILGRWVAMHMKSLFIFPLNVTVPPNSYLWDYRELATLPWS